MQSHIFTYSQFSYNAKAALFWEIPLYKKKSAKVRSEKIFSVTPTYIFTLVAKASNSQHKYAKYRFMLTFWRRIFFQSLAHPVFKM